MEDTLRPDIEMQVGSVFNGEKACRTLSSSSQVTGDHSAVQLAFSPSIPLKPNKTQPFLNINCAHCQLTPLELSYYSDDEMYRTLFIPDLQADRAAGFIPVC